MRDALLVQMALADVGRIREVPDDGDHPYIRYAHSLTSLGEQPDRVPWCSSWCCAKAHEAGLPHPASAMARSWVQIGRSVNVELWRPGDIAVFTRGAPPAGHVAIVLAVAGVDVWVVGGNQSDAVTVRTFPLNRLVNGTLRRFL